MINPPDLPPEQKLLRQQYDALKKEFAKLFALKDKMVAHDEPLLTSLYLQTIGQKKYEAYCLNVELSKLKHRFSLLQAYVNRREKPDLNVVNNELESVFAEYQKQIETEAQRLAAAKEFLKGGFLSSEESKQLRDMYYVIVKRLHPDINPDLSDEQQELFLQAQAAYELSDLDTLKRILLLLNISATGMEISFPDLQTTVEHLEKQVKKLQEQIAELEMRFPFIYKENLYDKAWIETEQETVCREIEVLKDAIEKYKTYVILLEEWKPE